MEFFIELYFILMLACLMLRGMLFHQREEKWYKTLIPGYNKYVLGKLTENKKLGLVAGISHAMFHILFLVYIVIVLVMMEEGTALIANGEFYVLTNRTLLNVIQYVWLAFALIAWVTWTWLMRNFSMKQKSSSWWMFMWAICPTLAYIYFVCIRKTVFIPSKGLVEREVSYRKVS